MHAFPGHIACDSASRAEIVVPVMKDGKVYAVLDVDSPFDRLKIRVHTRKIKERKRFYDE